MRHPIIMKRLFNINLFLLVLSVVCIFFITGCNTAKIQPQTITEKIIELADINNKLIILDYQEDKKEEYLPIGHQYVLFFLPLGNIFLERPDDIIFNKTFQELSLKGFHPISTYDIKDKDIPILKVKIIDSSLSAYDFLFLRKISSEITLEFSLLINGHPLSSWKVNERDSEWKEFAFEPQLNYLFNKVLSKTVKTGISQLDKRIKKNLYR